MLHTCVFTGFIFIIADFFGYLLSVKMYVTVSITERDKWKKTVEEATA
jgi:hypothetical protein